MNNELSHEMLLQSLLTPDDDVRVWEVWSEHDATSVAIYATEEDAVRHVESLKRSGEKLKKLAESQGFKFKDMNYHVESATVIGLKKLVGSSLDKIRDIAELIGDYGCDCDDDGDGDHDICFPCRVEKIIDRTEPVIEGG